MFKATKASRGSRATKGTKVLQVHKVIKVRRDTRAIRATRVTKVTSVLKVLVELTLSTVHSTTPQRKATLVLQQPTLFHVTHLKLNLVYPLITAHSSKLTTQVHTSFNSLVNLLRVEQAQVLLTYGLPRTVLLLHKLTFSLLLFRDRLRLSQTFTYFH